MIWSIIGSLIGLWASAAVISLPFKKARNAVIVKPLKKLFAWEDANGKPKWDLLKIPKKLLGAEDGIIPHERSLEDGDTNPLDLNPLDTNPLEINPLEEERRLFYVAITRARDKLYISSCSKRKRFQTVLEQKPSPFLAEIPSHLIANTDINEADDNAEAAEIFFSRMRERYGNG